MTQDELNDIPETRKMQALWCPEDEVCSVVDENGQVWTIGYIDGKRVKQRNT